MSKLTDKEGFIIDKYYNEEQDQIELSPGDVAFEEELLSSMHEMDILSDVAIEIPDNFFSLINKAEELTIKKQSYREFIGFILVAVSLLSIITLMCIVLGPKPFIILEVIIFVILPFSLIPLSKAALNRGDAR